MRARSPLVIIVLFPLLLMAGGLFLCREKSEKFSKIALDIDPPLGLETPMMDLPNDLLSQKFHYLKGGNQCFAYESEDQKYVIKFFKKNTIIPSKWLNYLPYRHPKIDQRLEKRRTTFLSYQIAYDALKEETALLYLHLYKTPSLNTKLTLVDQNGHENLIDLDRSSFVVQKKVILLAERIAQCRSVEEFQEIRQSLLNLVAKRCAKGLRDLDEDIGHNYGTLDNKVIQMDVGKVVPDDEIKDPQKIAQELTRVENKLQEFLRFY